jgi:tetratricopeptide (TPR) repeat protein
MELYIGYANVLFNRLRFEEALKYYNKILQAKPNMVNIYISIMMLYEFQRI